MAMKIIPIIKITKKSFQFVTVDFASENFSVTFLTFFIALTFSNRFFALLLAFS